MAVNDLILLRKGTATQWSEANPVLASGEPGYDLTNKILKIGDGGSDWSSLDSINLSSYNIIDFNSSVSGLLPVKNIVAGSNTSISSSSGIYTISLTGGGTPNNPVRGIIRTTDYLSNFFVPEGYIVGYFDLFQDGIKLVPDTDFNATDGSSVILTKTVPPGTVLEYLSINTGISIPSTNTSKFSWSPVPVSSSSSGSAGDMAYDNDYFYIAVGQNSWKRVFLSSWEVPTPTLTVTPTSTVTATPSPTTTPTPDTTVTPTLTQTTTPSQTPTLSPITYPESPLDLQISSGNETLTLSWGIPNNGGSAILDYVIDYEPIIPSG